MSFADSFDGFIFDYGGVLVRHQTPAERHKMARLAGLSDDQFEAYYWQERSDYDQGLVTGIEYWQAIALQADRVLKMSQITELIEADTQSWMNFDEPMWDYLRELRAAGKRLAILSNMPEDLGEAIKSRTSRLAFFDHVTLSYEIKSIKPEAPIYEHCLAGLKTPAKRTAFFDDKIANVKGAEMLGLAGIEFLNRDDVLALVHNEE